MAMLEVSNLEASYGETKVLYDVDLTVGEDETVSVLGPNGAGKTTLLRAISGALKPTSGSVSYRGEPCTGAASEELARKGLYHVPQEDAIFNEMTVFENLQVGSYRPTARESRDDQLEFVNELFPRLEERSNQIAGTLSGGERKMLAISIGLMGDPDLLMLDEPSSGLAPNLVAEVFEGITEIRERTGLPILLVEQRATDAIEFADRVYVLENGRIRTEGSADIIKEEEDLRKAYLGI